MTKNITDEKKKLIAIGLIIIALAFCAVYTSVKIGAEDALSRIQEFTASEAEYYQSIQAQLESINQSLALISDSLTAGTAGVQSTLEETMQQLTAMNAVFLDYGRRMGILIQEESNV